MLWNSNKDTEKPFCAWWRIFNAFVATCAVAFRTTHGQNDTRMCDTEGFSPVTSLNGVIGSPSLFIRYLIGSARKIWSVVYMNAKWIYASKNIACTISECAIVRNVLHVTSTFLLIYQCSGAANVKWTPQVWHASWNSVEGNFVPIKWGGRALNADELVSIPAKIIPRYLFHDSENNHQMSKTFYIPPAEFVYYSRFRLKHIQLIHQFFCGKFLHTTKFWIFLYASKIKR